MRELHDVLIGASFADGANEALIAARSAFGVRSFIASEIGLAVQMGDADCARRSVPSACGRATRRRWAASSRL
jgi:hypothetical protein